MPDLVTVFTEVLEAHTLVRDECECGEWQCPLVDEATGIILDPEEPHRAHVAGELARRLKPTGLWDFENPGDLWPPPREGGWALAGGELLYRLLSEEGGSE